MTEIPKMQRIALAFTRWIGSPTSIFVHTVLFAATIVLLVANVFSFDVVILVFNTAVSLEAIYLALFIQMTVNFQAEHLAEVGEDIGEIQEDVGEIQEDVEEISEDVDELQEDVDELQEDVGEILEDVEEINGEDPEEERREQEHRKTLSDVQADLRRLLTDIDRLKQQEHIS